MYDGYDHSSSHGSTIIHHWTCILIIVHVMLAYVLSMGMHPSAKGCHDVNVLQHKIIAMVVLDPNL